MAFDLWGARSLALACFGGCEGLMGWFYGGLGEDLGGDNFFWEIKYARRGAAGREAIGRGSFIWR